MPTSGTDILNYKGDANLGLATDTDIPVFADKPDLDAVTRASDALRLQDHQNNILLYQQKISDRDKALKLLAEGKVASGKILPEDKKAYDALEAKQTALYKAIKGMNDKDGISAYLQASKDLQDLVTNTQHRWTEITKLQDEKAQQTLPEDIQAYDKHINNEISKPIGELINPYQKAFSMDLDGLHSGILGTQMLTKGSGGALPQIPLAETKTVTRDANGNVSTKEVFKNTPAKSAATRSIKNGIVNGVTPTATGELSEFSETPERYYDLGTMQRRATELYLNDPKQRQNMSELYKHITMAPENVQRDYIIGRNQRIADYSQQRGIQPDANGNYPDQIKFKVDTRTGKIVLQETMQSLAAKDALASIEGDYVEKPKKIWDKEIAKNNLDILKYKADLENDKGKRAIEWAKFGLEKKKFDKTNQQAFASAASVINGMSNVINNATQATIDLGGGKTKNILRISDPNLLQEYKDVYTTPTRSASGSMTNTPKLPDAIDFDPETNQAILKYYGKVTASGKNFVEKEIPVDQRTWARTLVKRAYPNKENGEVNTLVDNILNKGGGIYKISQENKIKTFDDYDADTQRGIMLLIENYNSKDKGTLSKEDAINYLRKVGRIK